MGNPNINFQGPKGLSTNDGIREGNVEYRGGRHTIIRPEVPGMVLQNIARSAPISSAQPSDEWISRTVDLNHIENNDKKIEVLNNFYKAGYD